MSEECEHLQKLIELHRANLQHYEELEAKYGLDCPVYVKNAKEEARKGLADARAKLAALEGGAPGAEPSIPAIPQNLPPRGEFIGREREMEQVRQALASRSYLVVIEGIGGIGKTALALEVAHELWEKGLYEAVVWTTASDRALDLNDILDTFARTIDYPYIAQLPPEEKAPEAAKLMRAKKCLLLVDNFETIKDETVSGFLLNLPEPSKALITTRHHALGEARTLPLKGMEQGEALMLLQLEGERRSVEAIAQAKEKTLLRLYEATGGAPLALKWAVGQLKFGQTLDTVLDGLYKAKGRIFEHMFGRSWDLLTEHARRILMVMPIFAASASKEAIEAASDVHTWDLDEGLGQLVEMSLVEVSGGLEEQQRYSVHPLVRAFAGAKLSLESQAAIFFERAVEYFLSFAKEYGGPKNFSGFKLLDIERENILSVMRWAAQQDQSNKRARSMFFEFGVPMWEFLNTRCYWNECIEMSERYFKLAQELDDIEKMVTGARGAAYTYYRQGNIAKTKEWTTTAQKALEPASPERLQEVVKGLLSLVARAEQRYEDAERLTKECLSFCTRYGDEDLMRRHQATLGHIARARGTYSDARRWYEKALEGARAFHDSDFLPWVLLSLGILELEQGSIASAREYIEEGLLEAQRAEREDAVASCRQGLARVAEKENNLEEALSLAREAMSMDKRLGRKELRETQELVERLEQVVAEQDNTTVEED